MSKTLEEKYTLQRKLGEGVTGETWLATDVLHNRQVAIKFFPVAINTGQTDVIIAEAQKLTGLNHPNLVEIYECGFDEAYQRLYLATEYIEGASLTSLIAKGLSLETILRVTLGILHALQYLHNHEVIHQNLKPDNVLINNHQVKLTGVRIAEGVNNPKYVSPEQAENRALDGRSDLYSLGVMLFEMITGGSLPFEYDDTATLLRAHAYAPPASIRTLAPNVPLILERTTMRLLSKSPRSRYASADVVISVLGSIHAQQKVSQTPLALLTSENKPFINRTKELEQMETIWAQVQQTSQPRLLVVQGEMGIGKTRLVLEFMNNHPRGQGLVGLEGRCEEFGPAYAPFAQILTIIFTSGLVAPHTITDQIGPIIGQIPALSEILEGAYQAAPQDGAANDPKLNQWQFFEAVLTVLIELGPTILFLEDATLIDETSIALTRFLVRHGQIPLLLIAACSEDKNNIAWLDALNPHEKEILLLNPLTAAYVGQHLVNLLEGPVSEALVTMVYKHSQGNPSFVEEIIRYLLDSEQCQKSRIGKWHYAPRAETYDTPLPSTLFNLFTQRVQELSEKSRQALAVAAIIGPEFEFDTWVMLLGGDSEQSLALNALDEALDKRLLRQGGNGDYFFHPADIARVLVSLLSTAQRNRLHLQLVEYLLHKPNVDPSVVAYHYEQAGQTAKAAEYLEAAGAQAMANNAINQAIAFYNRANRLLESQANYEALGNLYRQRGAADEAIHAFNQALTLARRSQDYESEARILNGLSFVLWLYDSYPEADEAAAAVLKLPNVSATQRAIAQSHLGMILWLRGQLMDAEYWCQKAVELLDDMDGDEASLAGAYSRLGLVYLARSQYGDARVMFNESLKIRQQLNDYWGKAYSLNNLGKVATDQGDFEQAESLLISAQHIFENIDSHDGLMVVYANRARALLQAGHVAEAMPLLDKALNLATQIGKHSAYGLSDIYLLMAEVNIKRNNLDEAKNYTDKAIHLVELAGNQEYGAKAQALLAQIYAAQGHLAQAETTYQNAISQFMQVGSLAGLLRTNLHYAHFLAQQGQNEQGATLEQEARAEAARIGLHL
jgi:predicted ATPase